MPRTSSHQHRGQLECDHGFTLIEVLIAMAIFAIGFLAVWQMQIRAVNSNALGRDVTEAATLAASKTEELFGLNYSNADLDAGNHSDPDQPPYGIAWSVAEDGNIAGLKQVDVTVDWGNRDVPLSSYLVDHP